MLRELELNQFYKSIGTLVLALIYIIFFKSIYILVLSMDIDINILKI
jgi:hypothetical protein